MNRGVPKLSITVVRDSGTGELRGLAGTFLVIISESQHSYEFDSTLPLGHLLESAFAAGRPRFLLL